MYTAYILFLYIYAQPGDHLTTVTRSFIWTLMSDVLDGQLLASIHKVVNHFKLILVFISHPPH
jgi:hypothetical protein